MDRRRMGGHGVQQSAETALGVEAGAGGGSFEDLQPSRGRLMWGCGGLAMLCERRRRDGRRRRGGRGGDCLQSVAGRQAASVVVVVGMREWGCADAQSLVMSNQSAGDGRAAAASRVPTA